jgi:hypothetical protein
MKYKKGIFVENNHFIPPKRLPVKTYSEAMSSLIIACADAVIICPESKVIYLAKRIVSPMKGYWTIGGRRFAGETAIEAVRRNLLRETGIDAEESRFCHETILEIIWSNRKEEPTSEGKHDIINFFSIVLTKLELIKVNQNLLSSEYEVMSLRPFSYNQLVKEKINPVILYLYKHVFNVRSH